MVIHLFSLAFKHSLCHLTFWGTPTFSNDNLNCRDGKLFSFKYSPRKLIGISPFSYLLTVRNYMKKVSLSFILLVTSMYIIHQIMFVESCLYERSLWKAKNYILDNGSIFHINFWRYCSDLPWWTILKIYYEKPAVLKIKRSKNKD